MSKNEDDDSWEGVRRALGTLKRNGHGPLSREEMLRQFTEQALAKIRAREPLSGIHAVVVDDIVENTLNGFDPRTELGVSPKAGRRKSMILGHAFIAAHYLALRKSGQLEKNAASVVAELWGISPGRVRKIVHDDRGLAADVLCAKLTTDQCAHVSQWLAQFRDER